MADYGLIGEKLGHSFSKDIHNQIANYVYEPMEMTSEELRVCLAEKNFKAVNVTIPYKQEVIPYLDEMTEEAKAIGAVNCIRNDDGRLIGHNTDFDGLLKLIQRMGIEMTGKKVLILGTGGTSDTAYAVCKKLGAGSIYKVSRTSQRGALSYEEAKAKQSDTQIIINTTPVGMSPGIYECPIDIDSYPTLEGVVDVIYNPLRTELVSKALAKGLKAQGGLYMLTAQAVKASEFFISTEYEDILTEEVFNKLYLSKSNIVLTGMPAGGKTTVGKILAERLERPFYDTDLLIAERTELTIPQIFEKYGETYFRALESEVIKEVAVHCGAVIATGGGAVLNEENMKALKFNGNIFFIDRKPELLVPTADRPTASSRRQIMERYEERYNLYVRWADHIVKHHDTVQSTADEILEAF